MRGWLKNNGQQSLLAHLDGIDANKRSRLLAQLEQIDKDVVSSLIQNPHQLTAPTQIEALAAKTELSEGAQSAGESFLRAGKLALVTVAGGQGTRLGFDGPKGTFGVTPVQNLSLFEVFAQKIRSAQELYGVEFPWLLMTSQLNNQATQDFFAQHDYFGLERSQVRFFVQGTMPAIDSQTKQLLLASDDSLAVAPDGHGGAIRALKQSGSLDWLKQNSIKVLSYFQVDNPLVRPIDVGFVGEHILCGSEFSSKSVAKCSWEEKVGVFANVDGAAGIVEYSDLSQQQLQATANSGELLFAEANIAIHLLNVDFVERLANQTNLPYHTANKKISYVDAEGNRVEPAQPNAFKFEQFIFDAIGLAKNPLVLRVEREKEFSPVKNAQGADSLETSQADQLRQWGRWAKAAGANIDLDDTGLPSVVFEVSALYADTQAQFIERYQANPEPIEDGKIF